MNKFSVRVNGLEVELQSTGVAAAIPEAIRVVKSLNGFDCPEFTTTLLNANDDVSNTQLGEGQITAFRLVAMRSDHPLAAKLKSPVSDQTMVELQAEIEEEIANNITLGVVPFFFKWDK